MVVFFHAVGWGCYGMGFGRKADEDPEPGRCRRTDGKKWRCSKEAYPDSKYCEKHMHRGKNRSRKPVEMSLATPAPYSVTTAASATPAASSPAPTYHRPAAHEPAPYSALYGGSPYQAASTRPGAGGYHAAAQVSPFHLHLDTTHPPASYYALDQRDYAAYGHAAKEVGEHAFFSDTATERDRHAAGQWQFKQLGMEPKPNTTSMFPDGGYGNASAYGVDMTSAKDNDEEERRRQQHCFVLGADLRLDRPSNHDVSADQQPLRPFFDEWPHEKSSKGSWMGLGGETQLSMAIPMAANDHPVTSRYRNGDFTVFIFLPT
jgi:hypothetical protein